jgi:DNA uptake protein ComE-like DNA-binding protein
MDERRSRETRARAEPALVRPARSRWPWVSLLPIGFGSWVPIYAGVRARVRSWILLGALWTAIAVAGWIASATSSAHGQHRYSPLAGFLLILAWAGAAATSFVIRSEYERRMRSPLLDASERAEARLRDRRQAKQLARDNPVLAREMGVGRPDIAGAADVGLVDINNAPASALTKLPGVDDALAKRIVEARAQVGGFSTVEDLGIALDLAGDLVEDLRDVAIFLPR